MYAIAEVVAKDLNEGKKIGRILTAFILDKTMAEELCVELNKENQVTEWTYIPHYAKVKVVIPIYNEKVLYGRKQSI